MWFVKSSRRDSEMIKDIGSAMNSDVLGRKAQSLPKPGPFEPGPARPISGLELGLGWACHMRKPKAWAQARALRI
jgi:hypothetical protein